MIFVSTFEGWTDGRIDRGRDGLEFFSIIFSLIYYSFSLLSLRFIFFMVVEDSLRCVDVVLVTHIPLAFTLLHIND